MPSNCATPVLLHLQRLQLNLILRQRQILINCSFYYSARLYSPPAIRAYQAAGPHLPALSKPSSNTVWRVHALEPHCHPAISSQHASSAP
ncbi:hypothetical protein I79_019015 [Cricetulus griseus]|uniref:Uncharacterized protein n=1 Tax=Cricetulus griseus TaxID=10029 RepID=G3I6A3_CRIGR|nr:hypothetical protein I79_019015 [Cricetulus griseus]